MSDSTSSLNILVNIFASPVNAYEDLQKNYPILLPLLLSIGISILSIALLYSNIDYKWLIDHMVELQAGDTSPAQQEQMRKGMGSMSPRTMGMLASASIIIMLFIIYSLYAAYLLMISNLNNDGIGFKKWFSFISWSFLPSLLGGVASIVTILSSNNGQIAPETLNPLSLNELFFSLDPSHGMGAILASTDISIFWILTIMTLGYAKWTQRAYFNSFLLVSAPLLAYYAIRILMA